MHSLHRFACTFIHPYHDSRPLVGMLTRAPRRSFRELERIEGKRVGPGWRMRKKSSDRSSARGCFVIVHTVYIIHANNISPRAGRNDAPTLFTRTLCHDRPFHPCIFTDTLFSLFFLPADSSLLSPSRALIPAPYSRADFRFRGSTLIKGRACAIPGPPYRPRISRDFAVNGLYAGEAQ